MSNQVAETTGYGPNNSNPHPFRQKVFEHQLMVEDLKFKVDRVQLEKIKVEQEHKPETTVYQPIVRISENLVMASPRRATLVQQLPTIK